jgi:hypothetical protein
MENSPFLITDGCLTAYKGTDAAVTVPEGITEIGDRAFYRCAFSECTALGHIELPDSVTEIGECAFKGCTALKDVTMPKDIIIGKDAFRGTPCEASQQ